VLFRDPQADDVARARDGLHNATVRYTPNDEPAAPSWRDFSRRYGWRAYALPILLIITVVALMTTKEVSKRTRVADQPRTSPTSAPPASPSFTLKNDSGGGDVNNSVLRAAALPPGAAYTTRGTGTYRILKGTSHVVGKGQLYRYSIEVEHGVTDVDLAQFQHLVVSTLSDKRSWSGHGVSVERVDSGPIDFRVTLVSTKTTRKLCGYTIRVETSCYAGAGGTTDVNRVVFNVARWVRGATAYVGDLTAYRIYMINHEDGHAMGHQHAHQCLPGGLAPVMMQQTYGLRSAATGKLCEANPWPYPVGAKGAPGAEQPDTQGNNEYGLGD
jgi:hypothetical protein